MLTQGEVSRLFEYEWCDRRARVASLLAAAAGLRLSEVLGLRHGDVTDTMVLLTGRWNEFARGWLPGTKNGQPRREIPLPESVVAEVRCLERDNPHGGPWLFYCADPAEQLATILQLHPVHVRRLARSGIIPSMRIGGAIRFEVQTVIGSGYSKGGRS